MVAGPNGSGKSTLVRKVLEPGWIGYYLNPDEMLKEIISNGGYFDLHSIGFVVSGIELLDFFQNSSFLISAGLSGEANNIGFSEGKVYFAGLTRNAEFPYFVSVLADYIRRKLIEQKISFTFETVMSSYDKVQFLEYARQNGYRTYLYFVSTENADINVNRVSQRVREQGHSVPEQKIRERYSRSMDYLMDAIKQVDRAYIFDNSQEEAQWVAEVSDDLPVEKTFIFHTDVLPLWFEKAVMAKLPK